MSTAWNSLPRSVASSKSINIFITNIYILLILMETFILNMHKCNVVIFIILFFFLFSFSFCTLFGYLILQAV